MPHQKELRQFEEFLRASGQKLTRERRSLIAEIFASHYHFEADELLFKLKEKGIKTSRATIYRTLDLLVRSGLVRRVHLGEDHYHYERVTGNSHHDHLVCSACGAVIEFHDDEMETRQREICAEHGFTPTFHNLQILGLCESCSKKGGHSASPDRVGMIGASRLRR